TSTECTTIIPGGPSSAAAAMPIRSTNRSTAGSRGARAQELEFWMNEPIFPQSTRQGASPSPAQQNAGPAAKPKAGKAPRKPKTGRTPKKVAPATRAKGAKKTTKKAAKKSAKKTANAVTRQP